MPLSGRCPGVHPGALCNQHIDETTPGAPKNISGGTYLQRGAQACEKQEDRIRAVHHAAASLLAQGGDLQEVPFLSSSVLDFQRDGPDQIT